MSRLAALSVLEYADSSEASRFVDELASGAPGAWLTEQARGACARWALLTHSPGC